MAGLGSEIAVRWEDASPDHLPFLTQAGITCLVLSGADASFQEAAQRAGLRTVSLNDLRFADWKEMASLPAGAEVILSEGLWPGVSRGPNVEGRDDETASASRQPWVDANGYWVGCLRALHPDRAAILGYLPDERAGVTKDRVLRHDSLELALADAWTAGGNYLLAPEARFRQALLNREEKALEAWRRLGRTAAWLREHANWFSQPISPVITALVETGSETAEIANLLYRHNASPRLAPAHDPPAPDPTRILALVAVGLTAPKAELRQRILAHARAGASVIVDAPGPKAWWRATGLKPLKEEEDREFFTLGAGRVLAYKEPIQDPSEFALDVIDVVTHRRRAVRLWNAPAVIALAGQRHCCLVNYGEPLDERFPLHFQGLFQKATLLRPESQPAGLKTARRRTLTEVMIPELERVALVTFG